MTHVQLMEITFVCILSPLIRIVPTVSALNAGEWAGMSVRLGGLVGILYIWLLTRFASRRREGEGVMEVFSRYAGKGAGKLVSVVLASWVLFYAGFVLRSSGERITSAVFGRGNVYAVMALILLVSAVAARGSVKTLGRCGSTVFFIAVSCLAAILLPAVFRVRVEYIVPSAKSGAEGIAKAAAASFNVMTVFFYTSLLPCSEPKRGDTKRAIRFGLLTAMTMVSVVFCTLGALSPEVAARTDHPFFMMIRNVSAFGVFERIESVVVAVWVLTDFLYLAALMKIAAELVKIPIGRKVGKKFFTAEAGIIFLFSAVCGGNFFSYYHLSLEVIPKINMLLVVSVSAAAAASKIIYGIRNKYGNNMGKNR